MFAFGFIMLVLLVRPQGLMGKAIMKLTRWQNYVPIIIVIFLLVLPVFMHSPRYLSLFNQLFLNIVLAIGVYSVWTIGYINAAQPIFFGLGAYTVAILTTRAHWPFWATFPMAGIVPAIIATLFGFLGLKLKGAYFLFLTIAFCDLLEWIFISWKSLFGGQVGIFPVPQPQIHIFGYLIDFSVINDALLLSCANIGLGNIADLFQNSWISAWPCLGVVSPKTKTSWLIRGYQYLPRNRLSLLPLASLPDWLEQSTLLI